MSLRSRRLKIIKRAPPLTVAVVLQHAAAAALAVALLAAAHSVNMLILR
jgi:hypothetical protein